MKMVRTEKCCSRHRQGACSGEDRSNRREAAERARRQAEQQAAAERDVWAQQAACLMLQRAVRGRLALALAQQRRSEAAVQLSQGVRQQEAAQATLPQPPHPRPSP